MKDVDPAPLDRIELANSLSHGLGVLLGLVGVPALVSLATVYGSTTALIGSSVFGFCFLLLYSASTLYHSFSQPELKKILRKLDHISIYFLIAGSYTPFVLMYYWNLSGKILLGSLWGLTLLGIVFKLFFTGKLEKLSIVIYLAMGWSIVLVGKDFFPLLSTEEVILITAGGLLYSLGVIFYRWKKLAYHHAIWHGFVLSGSLCHFAAVMLAAVSS